VVGAAEQRDGECEAERFGGFHVDGEFDPGGLLDRKIARFFAFQDAGSVIGGRAPRVFEPRVVGRQTAGRCERSEPPIVGTAWRAASAIIRLRLLERN
jgi:hypothetical protein